MSILLYFLNIFCDVMQTTLSKVDISKGTKVTKFSFNKSFAATIVFLLLGIFFSFQFHLPTVIYALVYGIFLCTSILFGFMALSTGPMALSSIIASFSLVIPFCFGIFVFNEKIKIFGVIGIVLLLISIVLINYRKDKNLSWIWFMYAILTFLSNGILSLIQKYHQIYYPNQFRVEFMFFSMLTCLIIFGLVGLAQKEKFEFDAIGQISGVFNGFGYYILLFLVTTQKASVLFPVISVGKIIAVWFVSKFIFKEKLKFLQIVGLIFGISAIVLLNL